jgi:hypothetical protein
MITGDLVHMKIDGEVLQSTLGVVTSSLGDDNYRILWLDDESGTQGTYAATCLEEMKHEQMYRLLGLKDGVKRDVRYSEIKIVNSAKTR